MVYFTVKHSYLCNEPNFSSKAVAVKVEGRRGAEELRPQYLKSAACSMFRVVFHLSVLRPIVLAYFVA